MDRSRSKIGWCRSVGAAGAASCFVHLAISGDRLWLGDRDQWRGRVHNLPPVDVNADFPDVLKRLDAALMGSFLAKNGEWMVMTDLVWAKLSDDALVKPPGIRQNASKNMPGGSIPATPP